MGKSYISRIEIIPIQIQLNEPFVISKGALTHAKNTVVKIYSNEGVFGTGECCPYRSIHGETQEGTVAAAKIIAKQFIGQNPFEIRDLVRIMDRVLVGNASVKCAFDMALYDLVSKLYEVPLYTYLNGSVNKVIKTDMTISFLEKEKMAEKAKDFASKGFEIIKVKLGERPSSKDIDRMEAIRAAVGDHITLRIDANQGWNYIEARSALQGMKDLYIEHCEEPLPAWNIRDQIKLRPESPIPIMADESVFSHHDAFEVLSTGAADMINIKLGKAGGICHSMKIASLAQAADVYCQVGSFSESKVGITALVHFAYAWDHIIHYDLDSPLMHSENPVMGGMEYHSDWTVTVSDSPGHGAEFDPSFLNRFEIIQIDQA